VSVEATAGTREGRRVSAAVRRHRLAQRLAVLAGVWSTGLILAALLVPAYNGETDSAINGVTLTRVTLVAHQGAGVLLFLAVPVLAALLVLAVLTLSTGVGPAPLARRLPVAAWILIGILVVESLATVTSLGAFLLPVAVALGLALGPLR
jgi:hypothetical protein